MANKRPVVKKAESATIEEVTVEEVTDEVEEEVTTDEVEVETDDIVIEQVETSNIPQHLVKVKLSKDHTCSIGGEFYSFTAGVVATVPENVKEILSRNDLLRPI